MRPLDTQQGGLLQSLFFFRIICMLQHLLLEALLSGQQKKRALSCDRALFFQNGGEGGIMRWRAPLRGHRYAMLSRCARLEPTRAKSELDGIEYPAPDLARRQGCLSEQCPMEGLILEVCFSCISTDAPPPSYRKLHR